MSLMGHNLPLPHCNSNGRFTSLSRHSRYQNQGAMESNAVEDMVPSFYASLPIFPPIGDHTKLTGPRSKGRSLPMSWQISFAAV